MPPPGTLPESPRQFTVGTLTYTLPGLAALMAWLLWGDFCFHFMETVLPSVLPLKLKNYNAPNWLIGLFLTTIPAVMNATVCPVVSYWSDRHRGPRGRRIPFILYTIPFLCLFLLLVGLTPLIASDLVRRGWVTSEQMPALLMLGLFTMGFQFFNMFVSSIYYYLFNDVVPRELLGRFLSAFRFVGVVASAFFAWFVFPKAQTHFTEIFIGTALLYGVVFTMMCLRVKEGQYPEPVALDKNGAVRDGIKRFFLESFSSRFYWYFYLFVALWSAAGTIAVFNVFFAQSIGINLEQLGKFYTGFLIVSAVLLIPFGFLADKLHPLRTIRIAATLMVVAAPLPLVFLLGWVPAESSFPIWCLVYGITAPIMALFTASELPTYMKILPRLQYGQFSAATALVRSLANTLGGFLGGAFIDFLTVLNRDPAFAYRYIPIWVIFFQALATVALWKLYAEWKRRGGWQAETLAETQAANQELNPL